MEQTHFIKHIPLIMTSINYDEGHILVRIWVKTWCYNPITNWKIQNIFMK